VDLRCQRATALARKSEDPRGLNAKGKRPKDAKLRRAVGFVDWWIHGLARAQFVRSLRRFELV
jgi:hypothetical protein